jgi:DNA topoisomerase IA
VKRRGSEKRAAPAGGRRRACRWNICRPTSTLRSRRALYRASIIKALEEKRHRPPSTYAPIITTVLRGITSSAEGKALKPTILGEAITKLMQEQFSDIVTWNSPPAWNAAWTR